MNPTPEQIVEATLYHIKVASENLTIDTTDWKNRFMAEIVEEIRRLRRENEELKANQNGLPRLERKDS